MSGLVRRVDTEVSHHDRAGDDEVDAGSDLPARPHKLGVGPVKALAGLVVDGIDAAAEIQLFGWQAGQGLLRVMGECVAHWRAQRGIGGQIRFHRGLDS